MHWPIDEEDEGGTVEGMASIPDRATFIGSNGEGIAAGATVASVTEAAAAEQAATTGAFFCHVPHSEEKDDATNQGSDGPTAVSGCASPAPIAWSGAPPLRLPSNPFDDQGLQENITAGTIAPTTYMVHNGRQELALLCSSGASLIDRGLCLLQHTSAAAPHLLSATRAPPLAWAASSASSGTPSGMAMGTAVDMSALYDEEILAMAKALTGTNRAVVASRVLRHVGGDSMEGAEAGVRGGAFFAHGDFSNHFKAQLLAMHDAGSPSPLLARPTAEGGLGISSRQQLERGRLVVLNFWRSLSEAPIQRAPLAVCDATSMQPEEMRVYAYQPSPPPVNYQLPLPNLLTVPNSSAEHRWIYFPDMTRDEVLVIKT